jgi:hypothetical protein
VVTLQVDRRVAGQLVPPSRSVRDGTPGAEPIAVRISVGRFWLLNECMTLPLDPATHARMARSQRWFWVIQLSTALMVGVPLLVVAVLIEGLWHLDEPVSVWRSWLPSGSLLLTTLVNGAMIWAVPWQSPQLWRGKVSVHAAHPWAVQEWVWRNPGLIVAPGGVLFVPPFGPVPGQMPMPPATELPPPVPSAGAEMAWYLAAAVQGGLAPLLLFVGCCTGIFVPDENASPSVFQIMILVAAPFVAVLLGLGAWRAYLLARGRQYRLDARFVAVSLGVGALAIVADVAVLLTS